MFCYLLFFLFIEANLWWLAFGQKFISLFTYVEIFKTLYFFRYNCIFLSTLINQEINLKGAFKIKSYVKETTNFIT